jgi:hypothetical protein
MHYQASGFGKKKNIMPDDACHSARAFSSPAGIAS